MVRKIVELRHLHALVRPNQPLHDALLKVEDIVDLYNEGFSRVTRLEGLLHIETEGERLQNMDSGIMWNANHSQMTCDFCSSSWSDDGTGVILKCWGCTRCYHQDCHVPKVPWDEQINLQERQCCVCTGEEKEFCCHCRHRWSVDAKPANWDADVDGPWTEDKTNRLIYCEGVCGRLWHQDCYNYRIHHDDDEIAQWICDECQLQVDAAKEDELAEEAARAARLPRLKKRASSGALKDVTRVDGVPKRGLRIADARGSHLEEATWSNNQTRGRGTGSRNKAQPKKAQNVAPEEDFVVGAAVMAKFKTLKGMYEGNIVKRNADGTYEVHFQDGDIDTKVAVQNIKLRREEETEAEEEQEQEQEQEEED